jgi:hypothetical protein
MTRVSSSENCIDIIHPAMARLDAEGLTDVQIMGGIGSAALKHPGTVIIPDERMIVTAGDFLYDNAGNLNPDLAPMRKNGTLRDLDALVLSYDPEHVAQVEKIVTEEIAGRLDISIFPLHDGAELTERRDNPFGFGSIAAFVTDRYVMADEKMVKALPPLFAVEIDPDTMESWKVEIGGEIYPVVNPASAILNYLTRAIWGLRHKDFDKVQEMARLVFAKAPEMVDYAIDGPLKSQMELAGILQTLRRANSWPRSKRTLNVGGAIEIRAGSVRFLREHDAFILRDADRNIQDLALLWAITKSRSVGTGESFEKIGEIFQRYFEKPLDFITKNQ